MGSAGRVLAADSPSIHRDANGDLTLDPSSPILSRLKVEAVVAQARPQAIDAPGQVMAEPSRSINLLTPLMGRVVRVDVAAGDVVRRGQLLALIASGDMAQACTDEEKARAALVLAEKQFKRGQSVVGVGGAAVKDLESSRAAYEQAQAEYQRTTERLAALGQDENVPAGQQNGCFIPLVAPIDGVIGTVATAVGTNVTDPTAVLMTLVDTSRVWIVGNIAEDQSPLMHAGMEANATLPALPDVVLGGLLGGLPPDVQPDTRRLAVHFDVANPNGLLRPGMYAHVTVAVARPPEIMVPQTALIMNNDTTTVFVEVKPNVFRRRVVVIVYDDGADSRVLDGLSTGERVVTQGAVLLNDD
ncbi:MAG: efflux RND transporter periplasmic adaptor subunit [Acetobacter sp.]|uniref:efflux RND transporter periplasmic adaptor subunit n=1 Tax=Acetobacter sp. TaxID=440 RepID=UPI0039ECD341